jgi:hypothetical protein
MKHSILGLLYLLGVAILAMALLTFAFPPKAQAQGQDACMGLAEVAITSSALAKEKVDATTADKVLRDIYNFESMPPALREAIDSVIKAARTTKHEPEEFAAQVYLICTHKGAGL